MNLLSWIILVAVVVGFVLAVIHVAGKKGTCSCGCENCSQNKSCGK